MGLLDLIRTAAPAIKTAIQNNKTPQAQEVKEKVNTLTNAAKSVFNYATGQTSNQAPVQPIVQAPTFDANAYYNDNAARLTDAANRQRDLNLAQFRAARDKSVGEIGTLKKDANVAFQQNRDQTDFQSKMAASRLREMMAAQGLGNSGENVTGQVGINTANQNAMNALDLQQRRTIGDYDKEIMDLNDPSKEYNITEQSSIDLLNRLNQLQQAAADRAYDNDWKVYGANYQSGQDSIHNKLAQDQFDFNKQEFNVNNGWKAREHNQDTQNTAYGRAVAASQIIGKVTPELSKFIGLPAGTSMVQASASSGGRSGGGRRSSGGSRGGSSKSIPKWKYDLGVENNAKNIMTGRMGAFRTPYDFDKQLQAEVATGKLDASTYGAVKDLLMNTFDDPHGELPTWKAKQTKKVSDYDAWNMRR